MTSVQFYVAMSGCGLSAAVVIWLLIDAAVDFIRDN